jgi:peroxiredoxin
MQTQVLGLSIDSKDCLRAWAESLGGITYPLLADFWPHGQVAQMYGVLRSEGYSERAIFVIDKQGIIRYVDVHDIDLQPDNDVLFAELAKLEPALWAALKARDATVVAPVESAAPAAAAPAAPAAQAMPVTMYCTSWCPGCRRARVFFQEHGVQFQEVDIGRDRVQAAQVRRWTGGYETTPTFDVGGTIVVDFHERSKAKLAELLGIKL